MAATEHAPEATDLTIDREQIEAIATAARAAVDAMREFQRAYGVFATAVVRALKSAPQQEDHALTR